MTFLFISLIIVLLFLLVVQNLSNKSRLKKLVEALRKNDQNLLKANSSNTKPSAFHDLEQQIVEQIFEAETLEKRVGRREDLI